MCCSDKHFENRNTDPTGKKKIKRKSTSQLTDIYQPFLISVYKQVGLS